MKFYDSTLTYEPYAYVVAIGEHSAGNDTVGNCWIETKAFPKETPISEIIEWAKETSISGKLIITISEPEKKPVQF